VPEFFSSINPLFPWLFLLLCEGVGSLPYFGGLNDRGKVSPCCLFRALLPLSYRTFWRPDCVFICVASQSLIVPKVARRRLLFCDTGDSSEADYLIEKADVSVLVTLTSASSSQAGALKFTRRSTPVRRAKRLSRHPALRTGISDGRAPSRSKCDHDEGLPSGT
jgi:hypothetical protein